MMERVAKIKAQWISRSQARARFIQDEACTFLDDMKYLIDLIEHADATQASEPCRELREALGDALSLANVPEHAQDAEWNTERDRLTSIYNAALSTRGEQR